MKIKSLFIALALMISFFAVSNASAAILIKVINQSSVGYSDNKLYDPKDRDSPRKIGPLPPMKDGQPGELYVPISNLSTFVIFLQTFNKKILTIKKLPYEQSISCLDWPSQCRISENEVTILW